MTVGDEDFESESKSSFFAGMVLTVSAVRRKEARWWGYM